MIKPQDLRIGNLITHKGSIYRLSGVNHFPDEMVARIYIGKPWYTNELHIEPIPLFPEVLEQWCGLQANGFRQYEILLSETFTASTRKIIIDFNQGYAYLEEGDDPRRRHLVCVWNRDMHKEWYLHQFQNLVHALTGTELEVKVPSPLHETKNK